VDGQTRSLESFGRRPHAPDRFPGNEQYYCFFNWSDTESIDLTVPLSARATLTDFWTEESLGVHEGACTVKQLPPRSARLIHATQ